MRRLSSVMVALLAAFAVNGAQALVIDGFDLPDPGVQVINSTLSTANVSIYSTNRDITHTILVGDGFDPSSSSVGAAPNSPAGQLLMNNGSQKDSVVSVDWTLAPIALSGPVSFYLDVVRSNPGVPANDNVITAFIDGVLFDTVTIGSSGVTQLSFDLDAAGAASLSNGGNIKLVFNGDADWDFAIDEFGIPEPTSLALVGLALVGAGFAARRRKA